LRAEVGLAEFAFSKLDPDGTIVNLLYLESGIASEKPGAALYFRDKPRSPERVVPLLMTNLTLGGSGNLLRNLCDALAAYGTNATPALPQLTNLLTHPRPAVREAASNAVARIAAR